MLCDEGPTVVVSLQAEGLVAGVVDGLEEEPSIQLPLVVLEQVSTLVAGETVEVPRTVQVPADRVAWLDEGALQFEVDGALGLVPGVYDIVVQNAGGGAGRFAAGLSVAGPPVISGVQPEDGICNVDPTATVLVTGSGFLMLNEGSPTITVGGRDAVLTEARDCLPMAGENPGAAEICATLVVDVPADLLPIGGALVEVTNPEPASCGSREPARIHVGVEPTIAELDPGALCVSGGPLGLEGSGFVEGMVATVGSTVVPVEFVDDSYVLLDVPDGLSQDIYDVRLEPPHGCAVTAENSLRIVSEPLVYAVEPPAVPGWKENEIIVMLSDVVGEITDAWIVPLAGGTPVSVPWEWDPSDPSKLTMHLPADLSVETWAIRVVQDGDCYGDVAGTVTVAGSNAIRIDHVEPGYAWTFDFTAIDIHAVVPTPAGKVPFAETPRVSLSGPLPGASVVPLYGVTWRDETRLTATVPPGLAPGRYGITVVNPDGSFGSVTPALRVTYDAAPTISSVAPASLPNSSPIDTAIYGRNFRDPVVELECLQDGVVSTAAAPVVSWSYGTVVATMPATSFLRAVCVVKVTNSDGSAGSWSALSITNPAQNLFPWLPGENMVEARRAPAAASGRTSPVSRFVYAIGGDEGDPSTAKSSIEAAPIDQYGRMGEWSLLPGELPEPRTLADVAVIPPFVYVIGGNDGTGPVNTVWRSQIFVSSGRSTARIGLHLARHPGVRTRSWNVELPRQRALRPTRRQQP